jgi:hypothetical protein
MLIRQLTREDIPYAVQISYDTSWTDELMLWLSPRIETYPHDLRRFLFIRLRTRLVDVGSHGFVAVSEESDPYWNGTPEIVGYAFYVRKGKDENAPRWQSDSIGKSMSQSDSFFTDHLFTPVQNLSVTCSPGISGMR